MFEEYLLKNYNECSSNNTKTNDKRSFWLFRCNKLLAVCTGCFIGAYIVLIISGIDKDSRDKVYNIDVQKPVKIITLNEKNTINKIEDKFMNNDKDKQKEKSTEKMLDQNPKLPTPPENRIIIEDVHPKKTEHNPNKK